MGNFKKARRLAVEVFERDYVRILLTLHCGNVTAAAKDTGMQRSALQRLMRKYGIKSAEYRQIQEVKE